MISTLDEPPVDYKANYNQTNLSPTTFSQAVATLAQQIYSLMPAIHQLLKNVLILLIPLPLLMLVVGTEGLIEQESPDSLASLSTIGTGFFNFLDMHSLILLGAFGVTFIIWLLTRNLWLNIDDEEPSQ